MRKEIKLLFGLISENSGR